MTFKLYYDESGKPTMYTREEHEGNFIEVNADVFAQARFDLVIEDGKIAIPADMQRYYKLEESDNGTEVLKEDVSIIAPVKTKRKTKKMEPKIK
jgi:hypothetical protein